MHVPPWNQQFAPFRKPSQKETSLPTIHFWRYFSFRECRWIELEYMQFLKFMNENPSLAFYGWITFPWAPLGCTSRKSSPQRLSEIHTFSPQDCCVPAVDHSLLLGDSKKNMPKHEKYPELPTQLWVRYQKGIWNTWGVFIIPPVLPNKNLHHHHHHQNHHRHLTLIRLPLWATEPNSNFDHRSMLPPEMESCTFKVPQPFKSSNPFKGHEDGWVGQRQTISAEVIGNDWKLLPKRSKNKLFGKLTPTGSRYSCLIAKISCFF